MSDEGIAEACEVIKDMERNIAEMKSRILNLKKIKECAGCKEILDIDMPFCFKCGIKQPIVEIIIEEEEVPDCEELVNEESEEATSGGFEEDACNNPDEAHYE